MSFWIFSKSGLTGFVALALLLFIWQALVYGTAPPGPVEWERVVRESMVPAASFSLDFIFLLITYFGGFPTIVILGVLALRILDKRRRLIFAAAVIGAEAAAILTKFLVGRPRPSGARSALLGYSFPSAHALAGLVFYGLIAYLFFKKYKNFWMRLGIVLVSAAIIILIGYSRIYLGVHWPADILGGWLLGLAMLLFSISLLERPVKP